MPPDAWQEDCYDNPGICGEWSWCQLNDHKSWDEGETSTKGHCRYYAKKCVSCQSSRRDDVGWATIPGLNDGTVISEYDQSSTVFGDLLDRGTRCNPNLGLICANDIPSLPPTCLSQRMLPEGHERPTTAHMYSWGKRMLRMGAKNLQKQVPGIGPRDQQAQGAPRSEVHKGVNVILSTLWNAELWGEFVPLTIETTYDEKCCNWDSYRSKLSEFQLNRTHANFRNPVKPNDPVMGNSPPCVWCEFDNAYNDENPTVWKLIHSLTFNVPNDVLTEKQYQVLSSLPLWLREHLSCPLCRSHIKEHLIDLGVPRTRIAADWAKFFWRAHNYVNEQSEVTRCGSQSCGWGAWQTPPTWQCAGEYRYPWYTSWADATIQWRMVDKAAPCAREPNSLI